MADNDNSYQLRHPSILSTNGLPPPNCSCRMPPKRTTNTLMTSNTQAAITKIFVQRHFPWDPTKFQEVLPIRKKCSFSFSAAHFESFHFEVFSNPPLSKRFSKLLPIKFLKLLEPIFKTNFKTLQFLFLYTAATTLISGLFSLDWSLSVF